MKHNIFLIAGLLGIGAVIGATLNSSDDGEMVSSTSEAKKARQPSPPQPDNPFSATGKRQSDPDHDYAQLKQAVKTLQKRVDEEIDKRRRLEQRIVLLEDSIANGAADTKNRANRATDDTPTGQASHAITTTSQETNWFNEQALVDAGIDPGRVDYIKDAFEQAEMEKLYLRDQATREGWMGTQRYRDKAKQIADRTKALRSELSGSEYDAYLYATGQSNRVVVQSVLGGSPADNAGVQTGDIILQYGNERIYNWNDLTTATREGDPDTTVAVTIERNGQQQQVYVPRGPLGIRLTTDSVAP
ncbi:MAG: PDZ domain-containing protein [Gammaproteobacteria bacterium]|jgi:hypothetical protein